MERIGQAPRAQWQQKVEALGFSFHTMHGEPYWNESAYYLFSSREIDQIEDASAELHRLAILAVDHIISNKRLTEFSIPEAFHALVERSWHRREPTLYGRFDLAYDGIAPPKLLEYNADTPTALYEAAVVQWYWLKDTYPDADQFNSIHEKLLVAWQEFVRQYGTSVTVHFASDHESDEDLGTCEYLRDTCIQTGFRTATLAMEDIGWDGAHFTDLAGNPIRYLFKLYPWEWMIREEFGSHLLDAPTHWIEPPWKMVLSNKALLAVLWELFPHHPNLLPAYRTAAQIRGSYVKKPLLGREGANVTINTPHGILQSDGGYGEEGFVFQGYHALPHFDGWYAVIGSWIIGGHPAGIGIREDRHPITQNTSCFVPHVFR